MAGDRENPRKSGKNISSNLQEFTYRYRRSHQSERKTMK